MSRYLGVSFSSQIGTTEASHSRKAKRSATAAAKKKRGYSREFPIRTDTRLKIDIDWVPPTLYKALRSKATRVGVSLRALTLRLWKEWVDRDEP